MTEQRVLAESIAGTLRQAGHRALFAGGCVRDLILGADPQDFDIATSATPDQVQALFAHSHPVGASFGVVLVLPDGQTPFEVATFRRDLGYTDRRRPDAIEFTDEREDAQRRDFTINGLFLDPATGAILDYVGGRSDIDKGLIRAIGDPQQRIAEDRLRMLRAVRFASRFRFELDPTTAAEIARHASSIVEVSAERIRSELLKMLTGGNAARSVELLDACGLLAVILPEVAALQRVVLPTIESAATCGADRAACDHTGYGKTVDMLCLLDGVGSSAPSLALAVLLHDIGSGPGATRASSGSEASAQMADRILLRLRSPRAERERVVTVVRDRGAIGDAPNLSPGALKRLLRRPEVDDMLTVHRLECLTRGESVAGYEYCVERRGALGPADLRPRLLLTGRDLVAAGFAAGPQLGQLLRELEDAQLEGTVTTVDQALELIQSRRQ